MKLTKYQYFWLLLSMEITTLLLAPSITFEEAKQGAPMAMFFAGAASMVVAYIAIKLSLLYPEETFVEYVPKIIGKWLGKTMIFAYLLLWIFTAGMILRQYADFVHSALFMDTPFWLIVLFMAFVMVYAVYGGLHIVGRCSEVIGPLIIFNITVFKILTIVNYRPERILPLLPFEGFMPVLQGSTLAASYLSESFMIVMLVAFLTDKKKALSSGLWGVGIAAVILITGVIDVLLIMDNAVPAKLLYPIYYITQYISILGFIQNLDILLVVGTIFSFFIKLCLYMFMTSYGAAQLFHIRKWQNLIGIVGILIIAVALFPRNVDESQINYPQFWRNIAFPIFLFGIPLLLWMIGKARNRMKS
ncbi:endospore germination permease [Paenibacillus filicis]|uniref:Endospore germination permease n=1 Tax=Paenibacillus filicis TaxID=669464 RepID=A0ABU9DTC5_9BACL